MIFSENCGGHGHCNLKDVPFVSLFLHFVEIMFANLEDFVGNPSFAAL